MTGKWLRGNWGVNRKIEFIMEFTQSLDFSTSNKVTSGSGVFNKINLTIKMYKLIVNCGIWLQFWFLTQTNSRRHIYSNATPQHGNFHFSAFLICRNWFQHLNHKKWRHFIANFEICGKWQSVATMQFLCVA